MNMPLPSLVILAMLLPGPPAAGQDADLSRHLAGLPFPMPAMTIPRFPDRTVSIVDAGAREDTLATAAFDRAIRSCAAAGGGTVLVPPGLWRTGPIRFESNIRLHLESGALIRFSGRIEDFPLIAGFDGKSNRYMVTPPIHAYRAKNIAITGGGIIDGTGEVWRYVKKEKLTERQWKELVASGGAVTADGRQWWPSREAMEGEKLLEDIEKSGRTPGAAEYARTREYLRPDMVRLVRCEGVLIDGPTFRNSPKFHVHLVQSENIIVRNVTIMTPRWAQNGDGLDINACRNVLVANARLDVGDDAICLKPGRISSGQAPGPACENIVIDDCVVYNGHGGFVIGSESYGGARNIAVRNCTFIGTDVGLRFKSLRGRGGPVERVFIDGVRMRDIAGEAILFDMYYEGDPADDVNKPAPPVTEQTPRFREFTIRNVVCDGARAGVSVIGLPEMPVREITLEHLRISSHRGISLAAAEEIRMKNIVLHTADGPVIALRNAAQVTLDSVGYSPGAGVFLSMEGAKTGGISILRVDSAGAGKFMQYGPGVPAGAVVLPKGR